MEDLQRELIKKHIAFDGSDYLKSSVDHYAKTGKPSGSFFMALKAMMTEYAECVLNNSETLEKTTTDLSIDNTDVIASDTEVIGALLTDEQNQSGQSTIASTSQVVSVIYGRICKTCLRQFHTLDENQHNCGLHHTET